MIVKERDAYEGKNKLEKAGIKAEEKVAWYLKRAFGRSEDIYVFNDLRLEFDTNDYIQIDHLIMHPHGFFLIESKSVSSEIKIGEDGYWERLWDSKWEAMPSPIKQVMVQADGMRLILKEETSSLREKSLFGLIQRKFDSCPFDIVVAISNNGKIIGNYTNEVMKAENVCAYIKDHINIYKKNRAQAAKNLPVYFRGHEPESIKQFLLQSHCPKYPTEKTQFTLASDKKNQTSKQKINKIKPQKYHTDNNKRIKQHEKKPPHICSHCNESFEIRFGYSFYLYCPNCKNRRISIHPECLRCHHKAKLERQLGTRIVEYRCEQDPSHIGIYHKNRDIYLEDKK